MKNILYISLILTFLFGCKGNAFLKQRYTKLGHSVSSKRSEKVKANKPGSEALTENRTLAEKAVPGKTPVKEPEPIVSTPVKVSHAKEVSQPPTTLKNKIAWDDADLMFSFKKEINDYKKAKAAAEGPQAAWKHILKLTIIVIVLIIVFNFIGNL